jgi:hypothetical protein
MESTTLEETHSINEQGWAFYNRMRKGTKKSLFMGGPLVILFFCFCTWIIIGWSIYTWYVLIFPLALVTFFFYFSPIVLRGRLINALVTDLKVSNDSIEVETFGWFFFPSKHLQIKKYNIALKENSGEVSHFPSNCKISFSTDGRANHVYLIRDFFDNWESVIHHLKSGNTTEK